jgi:hypothetical protein
MGLSFKQQMASGKWFKVQGRVPGMGADRVSGREGAAMRLLEL